MKYPQLVSPRAVNAISDWLVSRLEQLGVESPQIYTRLLLSLLQSSVQVNDPIEFSNLEAFFANRKGGHNKRFHLPSDTETLKKLNAVQCLREIVSNEHETAAIELLVDELCEKLKDIEKRSQELNDEERFLIDTHLNIATLSSEAASNSGSHQESVYSQQQHLCRNGHVLTANGQRRILQSENALKDIDNDPKKRYFRAFPALTKEMEDSFRVWRRNAKSLTWPVVGRTIITENSLTSHSSSASSSISSSNFGSNINSDKVSEKKLKEDHLEEEFNTQKVRAVVDICGSSGSIVSEVQGSSAVAAASSKKKSKRRRNQALPKGKTAQNIRKITLGNSSSNPGAGGGRFYNQHHYGHHRNTSPTWDTDFKGCWEMGPDLIKEFLARQKIGTKRSRSNSDGMDHLELNECNIVTDVSKVEEVYTEKARPTMKRYLDISFCCDEEDREHYGNDESEGVDYVDEDYDDDKTLTSVPALISNSGNPRRLYQREGILQKPLVVCGVVNDKSFDENPDSEEQLDFASLKAKFNSNVEALWKDIEPQTALHGDPINSKGNANEISSAFYATTSLNALAPFKHDLWNFWSKYNQHNYDPASTSSMITTCLDDSSASSGAGAGADIANSSDYFSMPSNLDDFDKSVGAVRRHNEAGASLGAHTPSINVFLQNSIWSSSGDCVDAVAAGETDESFLYKVWHSNKKLSQIDVGNNKDEMIPTMFSDAEVSVCFNKPMEPMITSVGGNGAKLEFTPYSSLKWSEGINAGPTYNNLGSNNAAADMGMESLQMGDHKFATFGSAATVTGANWEAPKYGQNVQPDLKSWCASNPLSLTEMYGSDVCDSKTQEPQVETDEMGPAVTLPNHCATTSGFIAYSRIKQCGLIKPQSKPLQQQSTNAKYYFHDDEEENLLVSESTHFRPIENFVDGHSFSISSALDVVEFERSSSGYLCHESNEYMEYTRNEVYLADEEVANSNFINSAASASCQTNESQSLGAKEEGKRLKDNFVIKFRLKRTGEISCQTDEVDFQVAATKMAEQSLSVKHTGIDMFYKKDLTPARQTSNESIIAAVTKVVAAAAKVASQRGLDDDNSSLPSVRAITQHRQTWLDYPYDEVDSCINKVDTEKIDQFWSMQEVEKQCHQRRLPTTTFERVADIDRNDENSLDNSCHTLWGMCAVCNSCDYGKSMPANRMLRDELNLEADEIMSDLRYMQDLYIGEAADCCSDNADFDRKSGILKVTGCQEDNSPVNAEAKDVDHVQASMLQKVNQLIEDLLKPEQTGKLVKMSCDSESEEEENISQDNNMTDVWSLSNDDNMMEGNTHSWHYGNEQLSNIWQHDPENIKKIECGNDSEDRKNAFIKPMKLLRQVGGSLNEEELYMDKLNWEHEHLARIWQQKDSPAPNTLKFIQNDFLTPDSVEFVQKNPSAPNTPKFIRNDSSTSAPLEFATDINYSLEFVQNNSSAPDSLEFAQNNPSAPDSLEFVQNNSSASTPIQIVSDDRYSLEFVQNNSPAPNTPKFNQTDSSPNSPKFIQTDSPTSTPLESGSNVRYSQEFVQNDSSASSPLLHFASNRYTLIKPIFIKSSSTLSKEPTTFIQNDEEENNEILKAINIVRETPSNVESKEIVEKKNLKNLQCITRTPPSSNVLATASYKRVQQFLNTSAAKLKLAANRKRRHSASQNFYHQQQLNLNNVNNNNDNITDLNRYEQKMATNAAPVQLPLTHEPKQTFITCKYWTTTTNGTQASLESAAAAMMLLAAATSSKTDGMIAAPNYEDTKDEDNMLEENAVGNTLSCLDKNASILQQVAMITRPLTR